MKILLPESIKDITLGQFQKFDVLCKQLEDEDIDEMVFIKKKISLFSGIPFSQIDNVVQTDLEEVVAQIDKALADESPFTNRFEMDGIEYGFVENLNDITSGEYFDLSNYGTEVENLHLLMAVLFRPIKTKDKFNNYEVEKYKGTAKHGELMKHMPLNIVNGSLVFFYSLSNELRSYIQRFTEAEQARVEKLTNTLKNGDGIAPSTN